MKKIVSLMLVAVMIVCALAVNVSAAGSLYFDADFSSDGAFSANFFPEAYITNDNCAVGYSDARALQTIGKWAAYDVSFDVIFNEDEIYTGTEDRTLSFVYLNNTTLNKGITEERVAISACINVTDGELSLVAGDFVRCDSTVDLAGPISFPIEDGKEYHFGLSITQGHIRVFEGSNLLLDYVDSANQYYIGHAEVEDDADLLLWWNTGNYLTYTDIKVSTPEFLYPATSAPAVTTAPSTTRVEQVTVTNEKGEAVTNEKGEAVTDTVIITDAPADTNTGAVVGGNATATGDSAFIVVAAMVASLGCALIVRKVYVK